MHFAACYFGGYHGDKVRLTLLALLALSMPEYKLCDPDGFPGLRGFIASQYSRPPAILTHFLKTVAFWFHSHC